LNHNTVEVIMKNSDMPCEGHDKHLCALHEDGLLKDNFDGTVKSQNADICGPRPHIRYAHKNLAEQATAL